MNDYAYMMIRKYCQKGILVDTNLLLLYIVGTVDRKLINKFKRTDKFSVEDFHLVSRFIDKFQMIATTPHILTEVSNLLGNLSGENKSRCFEAFSLLIKSMNETFRSSPDLVETKSFLKFGLTDSAITDLAANEYLVFTDDSPLSQYLSASGVDVVNFYHLIDF